MEKDEPAETTGRNSNMADSRAWVIEIKSLLGAGVGILALL